MSILHLGSEPPPLPPRNIKANPENGGLVNDFTNIAAPSSPHAAGAGAGTGITVSKGNPGGSHRPSTASSNSNNSRGPLPSIPSRSRESPVKSSTLPSPTPQHKKEGAVGGTKTLPSNLPPGAIPIIPMSEILRKRSRRWVFV